MTVLHLLTKTHSNLTWKFAAWIILTMNQLAFYSFPMICSACTFTDKLIYALQIHLKGPDSLENI